MFNKLNIAVKYKCTPCVYSIVFFSSSPHVCSGHSNEYLIFQKIIKLEYEFPEKFFPKAKDLVKQLLVGATAAAVLVHLMMLRDAAAHDLDFSTFSSEWRRTTNLVACFPADSLWTPWRGWAVKRWEGTNL